MPCPTLLITNHLYRFFLLKEIKGISTFQDIGPLENDLLILVLSEVVAIFPLVEEPDFIVSLGTRTPRVKGRLSISISSLLYL